MQTKNILIICITAVLIAGLISGIYYSTNPSNKSTLNSDGTAQMTVAPDQARVYVGISILKPTAKEAQDEANKVITKIIQELNSNSITSADIQTENLNLYEEMNYNYMPAKDKSKSNSWRATQTLKIKTKELSKTGSIIDIAIKNGANQINNIEFYLTPSKETEYKNQVLSQATKNAKEKAEIMATGTGMKLGKIISISTSNYYYAPFNYAMKNNDIGVATAGAIMQEAATVFPQDLTISANINVVYGLK